MLQHELRDRIPEPRVFIDLDSIGVGMDFVQTIEEAVGKHRSFSMRICVSLPMHISGSASWALDVDIGAGVFHQRDPFHVHSW